MRWPEDGPSLTATARAGLECAGRDGRMVPVEQKDMARQGENDAALAPGQWRSFPVPLPACCRASGKRKREVGSSLRLQDGWAGALACLGASINAWRGGSGRQT